MEWLIPLPSAGVNAKLTSFPILVVESLAVELGGRRGHSTFKHRRSVWRKVRKHGAWGGHWQITLILLGASHQILLEHLLTTSIRILYPDRYGSYKPFWIYLQRVSPNESHSIRSELVDSGCN